MKLDEDKTHGTPILGIGFESQGLNLLFLNLRQRKEGKNLFCA